MGFQLRKNKYRLSGTVETDRGVAAHGVAVGIAVRG